MLPTNGRNKERKKMSDGGSDGERLSEDRQIDREID